MPAERLPESAATLYAELLEQALLLERAAGLEGDLPASLVEKEVRGRRASCASGCRGEPKGMKSPWMA